MEFSTNSLCQKGYNTYEIEVQSRRKAFYLNYIIIKGKNNEQNRSNLVQVEWNSS